jgi:CubicO group peptidase (beta-lactamase class C family)
LHGRLFSFEKSRMLKSMKPNRRLFLQQFGLASAALSLFPLDGRSAPAGGGSSLPRSTPEAEGMSSAGVLAFLQAIASSKHELHSLMVVRHGRVVAEGWWSPYAPTLNHTMYSMSKSFTSTAVGFAVAEKRLTVEDKVISFFPTELPAKVGENLAALRVKHLLTMSVGNEKEPTQAVVKGENWINTFLAQPITHAPGSVFMYNSTATYMCSAIVQAVTGQRIVDYLKPRLFQPLGIEGATWEMCPRGINTGGWGLNIRTEGLAKFGQLYLQKGDWNGRQVLPAKWVEEATTFKIQQPEPAKPARPSAQNDWLQGYGYQFWRSRNNAYRGDGAFGQFTIVLPEQDAVIVMTGESPNMQGELDLVWEHLLPAMKEKPLPADPQLHERLQRTLASLSLAPLTGQAVPPTAASVSRKTFQIDANELGLQSVSFAFKNDGCIVTFRAEAQGDFHMICGLGQWQRGETSLPGTPPRLLSGGSPRRGLKSKLVASGAWTDENTLEMLWRYYETPHHDSVTCRFEGGQVKISFLSSIARLRNAKDTRPVLVGRLVGQG